MAYFQRKSNNKFNARKTEYGGLKYDSKGEAGYAMELDWRIKAGEIQSYERQYKIPLKVNGHLICTYYMDFKVIDKHGGVQFHEYKGLELPVWQLKFKLLNALIDEIEPGAEIILIKHQSYKPRKK